MLFSHSWTSSVAMGARARVGTWQCPPCPGRFGSWDSRRSEEFLGGRGDGGRTRKQTYVEKHLTAANCLYVSGFWGLLPQTPPGICLWTSLGDFHLADPLCPPWLQILATPLVNCCIRHYTVQISQQLTSPPPSSTLTLNVSRHGRDNLWSLVCLIPLPSPFSLFLPPLPILFPSPNFLPFSPKSLLEYSYRSNAIIFKNPSKNSRRSLYLRKNRI